HRHRSHPASRAVAGTRSEDRPADPRAARPRGREGEVERSVAPLSDGMSSRAKRRGRDGEKTKPPVLAGGLHLSIRPGLVALALHALAHQLAGSADRLGAFAGAAL